MIHFHVMRVYNLPITALIRAMYPTIFFSSLIWKFQFMLLQPSSLPNSDTWNHGTSARAPTEISCVRDQSKAMQSGNFRGRDHSGRVVPSNRRFFHCGCGSSRRTNCCCCVLSRWPVPKTVECHQFRSWELKNQFFEPFFKEVVSWQCFFKQTNSLKKRLLDMKYLWKWIDGKENCHIWFSFSNITREIWK